MLTSKSQKKIRNFTGLLRHRRLHAPEDLPQGLLLHLRGHPLQGRPRALEGEPQDPRVPPARVSAVAATGTASPRRKRFEGAFASLPLLCVFSECCVFLSLRWRERVEKESRGRFCKKEESFLSFSTSKRARFSSAPLFLSLGKIKRKSLISLFLVSNDTRQVFGCC